MADAFSRLMERLLGGRGLVVFDCSDPAAKPLAGDVFVREVQHPGRTWQLAGDAGRQLEADGYHAQVTGSAQDGAALFHLDGSAQRIPKDNVAALEPEVRAHPGAFSPNVLLAADRRRHAVPDRLLRERPQRAGYLAQLKDVYEHFGVPMPLLYPRLSVDDSGFCECAISGQARFAAGGASRAG